MSDLVNPHEIIPILEDWVVENKIPVNISRGGWIMFDMYKHTLGCFSDQEVTLLGIGKDEIVDLHVGDPQFFEKLRAGLQSRIAHLNGRSWINKWLTDPGD